MGVNTLTSMQQAEVVGTLWPVRQASHVSPPEDKPDKDGSVEVEESEYEVTELGIITLLCQQRAK